MIFNPIIFLVDAVSAVFSGFLVPAVLGWLGFGAGGIAAGSAAASMMAMGGGATPAAVSVMQSIGATGAISLCAKVVGGFVGGAIATAAGFLR